MEALKRSRARLVVKLALLWAVALLPGPTAAGQSVSIAETLRSLRSIKTDEFAPDVPPAAKPLLIKLKHQLRDLILETLNRQTGRRTRAETLQARVLARLGGMGIKTGLTRTDESYQPLYGDITGIKIQRPPQHPELLAVTTTVSIHCGLDSSLYLFQQQGARWKLLLADEANNYEDISGGQGLFEYAVAPPDRRGKFFVVTVNVNPWCQSNWQRLRYKVFRPGTGAEPSRVIMSRTDGIYLGVATPYTLSVKSSGFTLTFTEAQQLDAGILTRRYVENFRIDEDNATRIAPIADRPEDFLDEWIHLAWGEAARWTEAAAHPELKRWHEKLHQPYGAYYSEFLFVQPCRRRPKEWQIGVQIESRDPANPLPGKLFFTIVRHHQTFFLRSVGTQRPAGCPGEASVETMNAER